MNQRNDTFLSSGLAIVIPCYNEGETLESIVKSAAVYGAVFVIDDGSTDGSPDIAVNAGAIVIKTSGRTGYDGAIERGLRHAYDNGFGPIVTIDGDGEHDPELIHSFARAHDEGAPLTVGIRARPQRVAEWAVCKFCRSRFGIDDVLCGMKGYSRSVLERYFAQKHGNFVNTWPALLWRSEGGDYRQIRVTGTPRLDQPRFASRLRANIKIASLLKPMVRLSRSRSLRIP